jgi:hypothetical protein
MNPLSALSALPSVSSRSRWSRRAFLFLAGCACSSALLAQVDPNAAPADGANANGRNRRGQNGGAAAGGRGNFSPEEMQQRMSTALREQFDVSDDAEWKLISDRITVVTELRRNAMPMGGGGFGGLRGGPAGAQGGGRGGRGGASPEQDALRQAITDKLPEAEIKSRLERLREVRKANEEKLTKAQDELRAILSVRQEAVAVMAGLLP